MNIFLMQLDSSIDNLQNVIPQFTTTIQSMIDKVDQEIMYKYEITAKFLAKFQSDIEALSNSKVRDSQAIMRMKRDIEQRKSRNQLINMAFQMQQGLTYQLGESSKKLDELSQALKEQTAKISWETNGLEVKIEKLQNQISHIGRQSQVRAVSNFITLDKKSSRIIVRVTPEVIQKKIKRAPEGLEQKTYEINYNPHEDRFLTADKVISTAVLEFNFHRNIKQLFDEVVFSHIDSLIGKQQ